MYYLLERNNDSVKYFYLLLEIQLNSVNNINNTGSPKSDFNKWKICRDVGTGNVVQ